MLDTTLNSLVVPPKNPPISGWETCKLQAEELTPTHGPTQATILIGLEAAEALAKFFGVLFVTPNGSHLTNTPERRFAKFYGMLFRCSTSVGDLIRDRILTTKPVKLAANPHPVGTYGVAGHRMNEDRTLRRRDAVRRVLALALAAEYGELTRSAAMERAADFCLGDVPELRKKFLYYTTAPTFIDSFTPAAINDEFAYSHMKTETVREEESKLATLDEAAMILDGVVSGDAELIVRRRAELTAGHLRKLLYALTPEPKKTNGNGSEVEPFV